MLLKKFCFPFAVAALAAAAFLPGNAALAQTATDGKHFGEVIDSKNAISYDELMGQMEQTDSLAVKVTGKVSEVCQKKGCWMTLVSEQPDKPSMRVTFKDYAFFMPKDLSGKQVVIDGYAYMDVTSVEYLRHYAEDAGKSKEEIEAITEPKRELAFEASGVLILDK
ncbi:MAG: DUF4920 domain-containing protein [Bacteroidetes bacterium]|nr:MAG: DUF4920 domain-containing protein [Bacteroidota bacterium]